MTDGIINIHGKAYQTVAYRVQTFRDQYPEYGLRTTILDASGEYITIRAEIWKDDFLLATGHAEEKRGSTQINRTSALENCETSAIGRALAAMGLGGTEFASANEVQNAIKQQNGETEFITQEQVKKISELVAKKKGGWDAFQKWMSTWCPVETVAEIPADKYSTIMNTLATQREPGADDN